jgi:hypothetical protein
LINLKGIETGFILASTDSEEETLFWEKWAGMARRDRRGLHGDAETLGDNR